MLLGDLDGNYHHQVDFALSERCEGTPEFLKSKAMTEDCIPQVFVYRISPGKVEMPSGVTTPHLIGYTALSKQATAFNTGLKRGFCEATAKLSKRQTSSVILICQVLCKTNVVEEQGN